MALQMNGTAAHHAPAPPPPPASLLHLPFLHPHALPHALLPLHGGKGGAVDLRHTATADTASQSVGTVRRDGAAQIEAPPATGNTAAVEATLASAGLAGDARAGQERSLKRLAAAPAETGGADAAAGDSEQPAGKERGGKKGAKAERRKTRRKRR